MTEHDPTSIDGYEVPLHSSLAEPTLFAGVPREFGILTVVLTLVVALGLGLWWLGLPLGLGIYSIALILTRRDPHWLPVFRRHLRQPAFLDS